MSHAKHLPFAALVSALALAACGGGEQPEDIQAEPAFHRLPVQPAEPADTDAEEPSASAQQEPAAIEIPARMQALETRGLTDEKMHAAEAAGTVDAGRATAQSARIQAAATSATVYTPAQVRAAYGLPVLPAATTGLSPAAAAALGAGQTIYIVAAYHHPSAGADLNAFSRKFGLPTCTGFTVPAGVPSLPKAGSGCTVAVVRAAASATVGAQPPAYNAAWASEIALDMQWAHATAPLARIVVIEAADAAASTLSNAVALANRMGPGVVNMSFGAGEGNWVGATANAFAGRGMTYVAATGDSGWGVSWPAVMPSVLAVGGTRLAWNGSTRSETAWTRTGGGVSAWVAMPGYQSALTIPGQPTGAKAGKYRGVADVAFNADPNTGQYVAFTPAGASQPGWYVFGGTSLAAPQWAGLVAVANAQRALAGKAPLGAFHGALYSRLAPGGGSYTGAFADVVSGANGTCAACTARGGYDAPTGLGSPRAGGWLQVMNGI